jgi:hypothetical protein
MKTIKTPEEMYKHLENNYEVFQTDTTTYISKEQAIDFAKDYHAQFFSTSEKVEKAKEAFVEKWYVYAHGEARMFTDLDSLIELVQNEPKATSKMPTEEEIDKLLGSLLHGQYAEEQIDDYIARMDILSNFIKSHLQEPEAPVEKKIIDALSGEEIKDVHTITSTTYPPKEEKKECPKCLKGCMDDTCIYHPNNR